MPLTALAFLGLFAAGLGILLWRTNTLKTDPDGYIKIADLRDHEITHALRTLEAAGIATVTDDHLTRGRTLNGPRDMGVVRLLVPTDRAAEALQLLRAELRWVGSDAPPA